MPKEYISDPRRAAVKRIEARRGFQTHLVAYIAVNILLTGIWAVSSSGSFFWPIFVMLGWGVGLVMNAWTVYGRKPITDADIEREMDRG
ncbi:MAG: hypothetical protein DCC49_12180 [Acidobacteria bacterium]|nr:MAG: hypothetical protein DCC49_12180 [Acidobacteriota bacterium]